MALVKPSIYTLDFTRPAPAAPRLRLERRLPPALVWPICPQHMSHFGGAERQVGIAGNLAVSMALPQQLERRGEAIKVEFVGQELAGENLGNEGWNVVHGRVSRHPRRGPLCGGCAVW